MARQIGAEPGHRPLRPHPPPCADGPLSTPARPGRLEGSVLLPLGAYSGAAFPQ
jgi:hypothetical protein